MQIFLAGGESRHWVHTASPCKENGVINASVFSKSSHVPEIQGGQQLALQALGGIFSNEDISCGEHDISAVHCPEPDRGGL